MLCLSDNAALALVDVFMLSALHQANPNIQRYDPYVEVHGQSRPARTDLILAVIRVRGNLKSIARKKKLVVYRKLGRQRCHSRSVAILICQSAIAKRALRAQHRTSADPSCYRRLTMTSTGVTA